MTADAPDAIRHLRAADPATDVEATPELIDRILSATSRATPAPIADIRTERAHRRRPGWLVASVAASLALVAAVAGASGFGLGRVVEAGAAPPVHTEAPPVHTGAPRVSEQPVEDRAPAADPAARETAAGQNFAGLGMSRRVFTPPPLTSGRTRAAVYAHDPGALAFDEVQRTLSALFGVGGDWVEDSGWWSLAPDGYDGPSVSLLEKDLSFSYTSNRGGAWFQCSPGCTPPSDEVAIAAAVRVLEGLGRDVATYEIVTAVAPDSAVQMVSARELITGKPVPEQIWVEVSPDGVDSAGGVLAPLVSLGDYPVVDEREAFDRLTDPRFGILETVYPDDYSEYPDGRYGAPVSSHGDDPSATGAPEQGAPVPWNIEAITFESVRLDRASLFSTSGQTLIVPAYFFADTRGVEYVVIGLAEEALDTTLHTEE